MTASFRDARGVVCCFAAMMLTRKLSGRNCRRKIRHVRQKGANAALMLLMAILLPAAAGAQEDESQDATREFWPEVDVYLNLNEKSRLLFLYSGTRQGALDAYAEGHGGIYFDHWGLPPLRVGVIQTPDLSRSKMLLLRVGYLFSRPKNLSESSIEHALSTEGTVRAHLRWSLLLSDRNRVDFRWSSGQFRWRYRNRLKLERTFRVDRFELTPYSHVEAFYSLDQKQWTRARYTAGMEWTITKRFVFDVYFTRQNELRSDIPILHAMGITLKFYLR